MPVDEKMARGLPINVSFDMEGNEMPLSVDATRNAKTDSLHPDLVDHVEDNGFVHHPYVVAVCDSGAVASINKAYEFNKRRAKEAEKSGDWNAFVFAHERPYRLQAMLEVAERRIPDEEYWPLVAELWMDQEGPSKVLVYLYGLLFPEGNDQTKRHLMMNAAEQGTLNNLPDPLTIYRGCGSEYRHGWSWTTNRNKAVWFAKRWLAKGETSILLSATCPKSEVLAYFNGRQEDEIVVVGSKVTVESETAVTNDAF